MEQIKKYYKEFEDELNNYKKLTDKQLTQCEDFEEELMRIKKYLNFSTGNVCLVEQLVNIFAYLEKILTVKGFYKDWEQYNNIFSIIATEMGKQGSDLNKAVRYYKLENSLLTDTRPLSPKWNLFSTILQTPIKQKVFSTL